MIRHIVFFRFKKEVDVTGKDFLAKELYQLKGKISQVRSIEVATDVGLKENSYDMVLNTLFSSMEDVEVYALHPDHLAVIGLIKEMCDSAVKIDYETTEE